MRKCSACAASHPKKRYSNNQWSKGAGRSRCKACIASDQQQQRQKKQSAQKKNTESTESQPTSPARKKQRKDDNKDGRKVSLIIHTYHGRLCELRVSVEQSVQYVKELLMDKTGFPPSQTVLESSGFPPRTLKSKDRLGNYISAGEVLKLSARIVEKIPTRADKATYFRRPSRMVAKFEEEGNNPFVENTANNPSSLVGEYDILYDWGIGSSFNFDRRPLLDGKLSIQRLDGKPGHIQGSISDCCTFDSSNSVATFRSDDWIPKMPSGESSGSVSVNLDVFSTVFFMDSKKVSVREQSTCESDNQDSSEEEEENMDDNERMRAGILIFNKRVVFPRRDLGWSDFTCERGDELMEKYNESATKSWLCNHLNLPVDAAKNIWSFWRTEPPPCLYIEKGDVLFSLFRADMPLTTDFCAVAKRQQC